MLATSACLQIFLLSQIVIVRKRTVGLLMMLYQIANSMASHKKRVKTLSPNHICPAFLRHSGLQWNHQYYFYYYALGSRGFRQLCSASTYLNNSMTKMQLLWYPPRTPGCEHCAKRKNPLIITAQTSNNQIICLNTHLKEYVRRYIYFTI